MTCQNLLGSHTRVRLNLRGITSMKLFQKILVASVALLAAPAAFAHIALQTPTPLLEGHAMNGRALKNAPFGAPDVDILAAPAEDFAAGSIIDIAAEHYVYHPGMIVVLWTRDPEGIDIMPAMEMASMDAGVPHNNLLFEAPVPPKGEDIWRASVQLPDEEGIIYLVVRQVMHDKFDENDDGTVSLKRIYYHQAAKLNLVR